MLSTAPVCTLELGHISSGIRLSRRIDASRPRRTWPSVADIDVVDDPHAVAQPVRAAESDGLVDGRQPERLAGMNGEARVVVSHVLERIQVPGRRVTGFRAGNVESDHAFVTESDRQLGDLPGHRGMPHRGDQTTHHDWTPGGGAAFSPSAKPASTASTTASNDKPRLMCSSGANRTSA